MLSMLWATYAYKYSTWLNQKTLEQRTIASGSDDPGNRRSAGPSVQRPDERRCESQKKSSNTPPCPIANASQGAHHPNSAYMRRCLERDIELGWPYIT